jgi:CRP/FNR family transcriptional regulator, anaerobic regulatory protein
MREDVAEAMDARLKSCDELDIPSACRSCDARSHGICASLDPQQLAELNRHSTRRTVSAGAELIGQAESVGTFCNILDGVVKLSKVMADGRQQIVGLQFAPDFMGRPFAGESRMSAEAATDMEVCVMPKRMLERMMAASPDLGRSLHRQALEELDDAREWMLTLGRKTAIEKVASFLLLIAERASETKVDAAVFDLPLSRADIADFLGLTIETVSRQITKLRKDGTILVENNRHVTVPDLDRLKNAAGAD